MPTIDDFEVGSAVTYRGRDATVRELRAEPEPFVGQALIEFPNVIEKLWVSVGELVSVAKAKPAKPEAKPEAKP